MTTHNRFAKLREQTTEVFERVCDTIKHHKGAVLTATAYAIYAGLAMYEPNAEAHPVLHAITEGAHVVHDVQDAVEQAGATETIKLLAEMAYKGCLTPLLTTQEGLHFALAPAADMVAGVKEIALRGCEAAQELVERGIVSVRHSLGLVKSSSTADAIDPTGPLFDSSGYEHTLVAVSAGQIVTSVKGQYGLWDRRTGHCLVTNCEDMTLSNVPPDPALLAQKRAEAFESWADWQAEAAIARARSGGEPTVESSHSPEP